MVFTCAGVRMSVYCSLSKLINSKQSPSLFKSMKLLFQAIGQDSIHRS